VAVACGEHLVSQVYPAAVPIEVFIDDAVFLVAEELKRRGADGPDPGGYELRRVNGTRLDPARTLDELGIGDGSTLVLAAAESGDPFEPHYESLSTGLANVARRLFPPVTERTAAQTALLILGLVATAVIVLAWHERAATDSLAPAAVAGSYGCLLAVGALWVRGWWPQRRELLCGSGWLAVAPLAFAAAATAPGVPGSAHLFIGAVAACVLVIGATILIRGGIAFGAAAAALCALTSVTAAIRMWRPVPGPVLGIGILAGLLFLLTAAPTVALWSARLRPPHFGSVTGRDLFRRSDGMPLDAVAPVESGEAQPDSEDRPDSDRTPRGAAIVASALRGNAVLTGRGSTGPQITFALLDIERRRQAEVSIAQAQASLQRIIETAPLAIALFTYILTANWLGVLPVQYTDSSGATSELLKPPAADINFVLALALFVFLCYHLAGFWRRGLIGHPIKVLKGHVAVLAPINLVEEIAKPISLSLRLFGNLFAGGIMLSLIALFPPWIMWAPNAIWKTFDLFVGLIQAFIFALLTILYFSQSMELDEEHH